MCVFERGRGRERDRDRERERERMCTKFVTECVCVREKVKE